MHNTTTEIKLPKLNFSKIKSLNTSNSVERDLFLTSADDLGFAQNQVSQIDHNISIRKEHNMKLWDRPYNNNIYCTSGRSNYSVLKELQSKFLLEPKNLCKVNWKKQNYYLKTDINSILESAEISKLVKTKVGLKNKYKIRDDSLIPFINNRRTMYVDTMLLEIIKNEKNKINKKTEEYSTALLTERENLKRDMKLFENFTMRIGADNRSDETKIVKLIQGNKILVELYKHLSQEYNGTINEIHRYLKLITIDKSYANFMHKISGGDHEILHCDLNDNINYVDLKENELNKLLKNIFSKMKNTLNDNDSNNKNELFDDIDSVNQADLEIMFKIKEENILNLLKEKQRYIEDINIIKENLGRSTEDYEAKLKICQDRLLSLLDEVDKEQQKMNFIGIDKETQNYNNFIEQLLIELNCFIFNKENKKKKDEITIIPGVIIPTIKEISNMEVQINDLSNLMSDFNKEDHELFRKISTKLKLENRAKKLIEERRLIEYKQMLKKQDIMNKINRIIYKGRSRYTSEGKIKKNKVKKAPKVDQSKIDMEMLYYD